MRSFEDRDGNVWDAVVGRESYGAVVVMFVPRSGENLPRQALLEVKSTDEGNRTLREMTSEALEDLLRSSTEREI